MNETLVRAVDMVRAIRDEIYEETKHFSREELKEFIEREATAMQQECLMRFESARRRT